MGELFGFSSGASVRWALHRRLQQAGHYREEGWGVTVFEGPATMSLRQARGSPDEPMAAVLGSGRLEGEVGLTYIRRWTHSARLANCHPFVREMGGREWAFAHNGRVDGVRSQADLRPARFRPVGSTDSEYAFCVLLEAIAPAADRPPESHADDLRRVSAQIARHGAFNYLLASEGCLYAYSSGEYGLWTAEVPEMSAQPAALADEDWSIELRPDGPGVPVFLAASNPMGAGLDWRRLQAGELAVAAAGRPHPQEAGRSGPGSPRRG